MSPPRQAGRDSRSPSAARIEHRSPSLLIRLHQDIAFCTACPSLTPFQPTAYGTAATRYLMVGEAPGYRSWSNGRRFTGPAGVLIRRALRAVGHARYADLEDLFYLTDVVKCHPAQPQNGPSNRSPRRAEIDTCLHHLVREIEVLRPCVIVTFGKVAAEAIPKALGLACEGGLRCEAPEPEIMSFPRTSPRNQVAIRKHYPSMEAFACAITDAFRGLIGRLEGGLSHA